MAPPPRRARRSAARAPAPPGVHADAWPPAARRARERPARALRAALAAALVLAAGCAPRAEARGPTVLMSSAPGAAGATRAARGEPADAELERRVERSLGVLREGAAAELVREIGARVAAASPREGVAYRFAIVDREQPNAFALPTGRIYVSRGLLALLDGPDELAGVLGHEVAHVAARHAEGRARQAVAATVLSTLSLLAAGLGASTPYDAALAGPAAQAAAAGALAAYSREQEREADELGEALAAAAGYAPGGLARALRALDHERRLREGASALPRFFDTHPGGAERFAAAAVRRAGPEREGEARGREAFLRALDGLVVGPDPAAGVFDGSRFLHPGLDLALRFPEGWTLANAPAAVVAVAPQRDAAISLEMAAPAASLEARVRADVAAGGVSAFAFDALRIGEAPAMRVVGLAASGAGQAGAGGPVAALDVTWVARPEGIYRITGRSSEERFRRHAGAFLAAAKSLRRMTPGERASLRVLRVRVIEGEAQEDLADVARRSGTPWTPAEIAIANGLAPGARLQAPRLLKVARSEPWEAPPAPNAGARPAAPAPAPGPTPAAASAPPGGAPGATRPPAAPASPPGPDPR